MLDNTTVLARNFEHFTACHVMGRGDQAETLAHALVGVKHGWSPLVAEAVHCLDSQMRELASAWLRPGDSRKAPLQEAVGRAALALTIKAAVAAGSTTDSVWAGPLVALQTLVGGWFASLRNASALDALAAEGMMPAPSGSKLSVQTLVGVGDTPAELGWKRLSALSFDGITSKAVKAMAALVISDDLARFGGVNLENALSAAMRNAVSLAADAEVFSILLNGISPTASSGNARKDIQTLLEAVPFGQSSRPILFVAPDVGKQLALLGEANGPPTFPDLSVVSGGMISNMPVLPIDELHSYGSPASDMMVLVDASQCAGDAGTLILDVAKAGSIAMLDDATGAQSMTSLYQTNSLCLRLERWFSLDRVRSTAVAAIDGVAYSTGSPS